MKINIINKLPFIVVTGLNFSTILLTLIACTLRKYYEVLNLYIGNNYLVYLMK